MKTTEGAEYRILLATDDSESARVAEDWIAQARWPEQVVVDVLCVASSGVARLGWPRQDERSAVSQAIEKLRESEVMAAERIANDVGIRLQRAGLTTRSWARQGDSWTRHANVASEVLATIDLERPDLVVVGPRGRSTLAQLLLGSVSRRIVSESRAPVLVTRKAEPTGGRVLPRSLLVLVDGTRATDHAIDHVIASGWARDTSITLLGLLGFRPGVEFDDPELVSQVDAALREEAASTLEATTARLTDDGARVGSMLESGHPHETAIRIAGRLQPDAIVVARPSGPQANDPFAENIARYATISTVVVPET